MASLYRRPINRLTLYTVFLGFKINCRLAISPTKFFTGSTTEGIKFRPSAVGITLGFPPSITATAELVVPRSIPIILLIFTCLLYLLELWPAVILYHLKYNLAA